MTRHAEACACLTPREREMLVLLCGGMKSGSAAAHVGLSQYTVMRHADNIRSKLGVQTMIQAAVIATKAGIL